MIKKILNVACLAAIVLALVSCGIFRVYRQNIQQGNVITPKQLKSIHHGMSRQQVINKLGYPLLSNIYYPNQLIYLYSYQPAYDKLTNQYLILFFRNNRVMRIETNMHIPDGIRYNQSIQKRNRVTLPQPTK